MHSIKESGLPVSIHKSLPQKTFKMTQAFTSDSCFVYLKFPRMQSTADSAKSDSLDVGWNIEARMQSTADSAKPDSLDVGWNIEARMQSTADSAKPDSLDVGWNIEARMQSTADSAKPDSLDVGWNIEEEVAEAHTKETDGRPCVEGVHWVKGKLIGSGSCFLANNGTMFSVKQETDGQSGGRPYIEGVHWVKGKLIIGTGAFCSCFLARDMDNGTMFAVKQVRAQEEERLQNKVSMLERINHPNIVRCLGATQHDGHINIFIEWMAGGCLDQLLHDFGYFGENVICNYTKQITHGIVFLHENGIIHRDLKGGNILLDSTGRRLRIADFGAAARLATHTTGSGEFQNMEGTVAFMAPEVVKGGSEEITGYGRKCDVWSIGCVIIQMSTAKPPWAGTYDQKNKFQLIFKIGQATAPPPMPEFSNPALKDFTLLCLEVKPEDRPTSTQLLKHPLFTAF